MYRPSYGLLKAPYKFARFYLLTSRRIASPSLLDTDPDVKQFDRRPAIPSDTIYAPLGFEFKSWLSFCDSCGSLFYLFLKRAPRAGFLHQSQTRLGVGLVGGGGGGPDPQK